jgi:hypothetical protein
MFKHDPDSAPVVIVLFILLKAARVVFQFVAANLSFPAGIFKGIMHFN